MPHTLHDSPSIIAVGAVKERKGYLQAIDALAAYRDKYKTPFRYEIFGSLDHDPAYVASLRTKIAQYGLQDCCFLHGPVSDGALRAAYAKADCFLLTSIQQGSNFEGFGLVFLEASAYGVPVIGPTTGGCPEAISEGKSGYVCDPNDAVMIAKRMDQILKDHTISAKNCRAWAEEHRIEKKVDELERVYTSLLGA